ncbi:MAG: hypothetical protein EXS16_22005 [Gemmataceae bacterium]|nr:hypothetical protein [Gemmataceae bacterium]
MNSGKARVIKPPTPIVLDDATQSVFLAGSIEMGRAEDWQSQVTQALADLNIVILNPRRDAWDATWEQSIHNPSFREQVEWELQGLEQTNMVAMYFSPDTKAPITLLELGLIAASRKAFVCCPPGYWRKGNIEVICHRYGLPMVETLAQLIDGIKQRLLA